MTKKNLTHLYNLVNLLNNNTTDYYFVAFNRNVPCLYINRILVARGYEAVKNKLEFDEGLVIYQ